MGCDWNKTFKDLKTLVASLFFLSNKQFFLKFGAQINFAPSRESRLMSMKFFTQFEMFFVRDDATKKKKDFYDYLTLHDASMRKWMIFVWLTANS